MEGQGLTRLSRDERSGSPLALKFFPFLAWRHRVNRETVRADAARRARRRRARASAGRRVRHARRHAARVRPIRRDAAGDRRRALGLVVAPDVGSDERHFADGVRDGERAWRRRSRRVRGHRSYAQPDGRPDQARAGPRAARLAGQFHLDGGRHRLHRGRGHADHRRAAAQFLRDRDPAGGELHRGRRRFRHAPGRDRMSRCSPSVCLPSLRRSRASAGCRASRTC